ncbi:MAG: PEP-CTERM sorting domain-containing protein [Kiritimatiellia bacterium]
MAVSVYDENVNEANTVDDSETTYTAANMQADITANFANGLGGVINFDNDPDDALDTAGTVVTSYGTDKTLTLSTASVTFATGLGTAGSRTPISGDATASHMLSVQGVATVDLTLSGSGLLPGEVVSAFGFTVLSRTTSGGLPRLGTLTVTYSDLSTASSDFSYAGAAGTNDTFVGYSAPSGLGISSFTLDLNRDYTPASGDSFTSIDDFGFVTIPEPSSILLLGLGLASALFLRRRN